MLRELKYGNTRTHLIKSSKGTLLSHQLKTVYYVHPLPDDVSRWQSFEEYRMNRSR